jgi:hypothetical protein
MISLACIAGSSIVDRWPLAASEGRIAMKQKLAKRPKSKGKSSGKLSLVLEKLEHHVENADAAAGSCIRVYCLPAV